MSNPTSNFGWVMPTSTDLVTDLPADFAVFGQAVDTTMAGLKGGTTGQILSKTSATDMAFTWTTPNPGDITAVTAGVGITGGGTSGDVTITNSMATAIDAKGDLVSGTGADAFARVPVGTDGQVLTANSANANGLGWTTPVSGSLTQIASFTANNTTGTWTVSSIASTYKNIVIVGQGLKNSTASTQEIGFRFNGDTGANYTYGAIVANGGTVSGNGGTIGSSNPATFATVPVTSSANAALLQFVITIPLYSGSGYKSYNGQAIYGDGGVRQVWASSGTWASTAAITSITTAINSGNLSSGTMTMFGVN